MSKFTCVNMLERAVYNKDIHYKTVADDIIFNALVECIAKDMTVFVPIETPEEMLKRIGTSNDGANNDSNGMISEENVRINLRRMAVDNEGHYVIPIFSSAGELKKGPTTTVIHQQLKNLFDAVDSWEGCTGFVLNPWDKKFLMEKPLLDELKQYKAHSNIYFVKGSILDVKAGAYVNMANTGLLQLKGPEKKIVRTAGLKLIKECKALNGCKVGEVKSTLAYDIKQTDMILHTVAPDCVKKQIVDINALADCYTNVLDTALKNDCTSVAFSGIFDVYGANVLDAVKQYFCTVKNWLDAHPDTVMDIFVCCSKKLELKMLKELSIIN